MRLLIRLVLLTGLATLLAGGVLLPAGTSRAAAVPNGCLPDGTCVAISYTGPTGDLPYETQDMEPPMTLGWHIAVLGGTLSSATLVTHNDPSAILVSDNDPSAHTIVNSLRINGSAPDPAAVSTHGRDLTIDLAWLMPLPAGHGIDISYSTVVWPLTPTLVSTVAFTFDDAAHAGPTTVISPPGIWHAELPDVGLSTSRSSLPIPRGGSGKLDISVANHNPKAPAWISELRLDFPPGFDLLRSVAGPDEYVPTFCRLTGSRQWTCYRPHGAAYSTTLTFAAAPGLRPGSSGLLRLRLDSEGLMIPQRADANPADNTRYVRLTAIGAADLRINIEPPAGGALPAGSAQPVTVRISNAGPDEATGIIATVNVSTQNQPPRLAVLGVDGRRWQPNQTSQRLPLSRLLPGRTATFTLTLTGATPGISATVTASAQSQSYDAGGASAQARLRVIPAGQAAALPPTRQLAATGTRAEAAMLLGVAFLTFGLLLLVIARRRANSS